jgi:hypothetical protein
MVPRRNVRPEMRPGKNQFNSSSEKAQTPFQRLSKKSHRLVADDREPVRAQTLCFWRKKEQLRQAG